MIIRSGKWQASIALTALVVVFCVHWLDLSLVAKVAPVIATGFKTPLHAMTYVFIATRLGMVIGAMVGGAAGDRWGRKAVLCVCLGLASLLSLASALVVNLSQFAVLRAVSGLLLGGAAPCVLALVASIAPDRWRSMAIAVTLAGASVGSSLASLLAYLMIGPNDWRLGFFICAAALFGALLLMLQFVPGIIAPVNSPKQTSIRDLFGAMRFTTIVICGAFLLSMGLNALLASWLPSFFQAFADVSVRRFAGIAMFTTPAAIIGMLAAGGLSLRIATRTLVVAAFACHACALVLIGQLSFGSSGFIISLAAVSCTQALCHGVLNLAVVAYYPPALRATALGCAVAAGRFGGVFAPVLGAYALAVQPAMQTLFLLLASIPLCVSIMLWLYAPINKGWQPPKQYQL